MSCWRGEIFSLRVFPPKLFLDFSINISVAENRTQSSGELCQVAVFVVERFHFIAVVLVLLEKHAGNEHERLGYIRERWNELAASSAEEKANGLGNRTALQATILPHYGATESLFQHVSSEHLAINSRKAYFPANDFRSDDTDEIYHETYPVDGNLQHDREHDQAHISYYSGA